MKRILIAGCGYVGTALGRLSTARDDRVWGLRRHPAGLPEPIVPIEADLARPETLRGLPADLDAVVYAVSADSGDVDSYRRAYVEGPRQLWQALESQGKTPRRFLYVSSTGVYGESSGAWVDETTDPNPSRETGSVLLEGETLVRSLTTDSVVLRLSGIYGPGRTRLIDRVRAGEVRLSGPPPTWSNRIHRDDCAGALLHLIDLEAPDALYLGVDTEPVPMDEVYCWLAARMGLPKPPRSESADAGDAGEAAGSTSAGDAATENSERSGRGKRCRGDRLRASGYRFLFPTFRDGYADMIAGEPGAGSSTPGS